MVLNVGIGSTDDTFTIIVHGHSHDGRGQSQRKELILHDKKKERRRYEKDYEKEALVDGERDRENRSGMEGPSQPFYTGFGRH